MMFTKPNIVSGSLIWTHREGPTRCYIVISSAHVAANADKLLGLHPSGQTFVFAVSDGLARRWSPA